MSGSVAFVGGWLGGCIAAHPQGLWSSSQQTIPIYRSCLCQCTRLSLSVMAKSMLLVMRS